MPWAGSDRWSEREADGLPGLLVKRWEEPPSNFIVI
jgi:hypothetical protein